MLTWAKGLVYLYTWPTFSVTSHLFAFFQPFANPRLLPIVSSWRLEIFLSQLLFKTTSKPRNQSFLFVKGLNRSPWSGIKSNSTNVQPIQGCWVCLWKKRYFWVMYWLSPRLPNGESLYHIEFLSPFLLLLDFLKYEVEESFDVLMRLYPRTALIHPILEKMQNCTFVLIAYKKI